MDRQTEEKAAHFAMGYLTGMAFLLKDNGLKNVTVRQTLDQDDDGPPRMVEFLWDGGTGLRVTFEIYNAYRKCKFCKELIYNDQGNEPHPVWLSKEKDTAWCYEGGLKHEHDPLEE